MEFLKISRLVYVFQVLCIIKNKSTFLLIKYSVPAMFIKWTNLFELKVWMSSFVNIGGSGLEVPCKTGVPKIKIFQDSLKGIRDAVFNLIKFQAKGPRLYWKETLAYVLS